MSIASRTKTYGVAGFAELDDYGQRKIPKVPTRFVDMDIELLSATVGENAIYKDAQYIGITKDTLTDQDFVFFNGDVLKVLYVNGHCRLNQVFMARVGNGLVSN